MRRAHPSASGCGVSDTRRKAVPNSSMARRPSHAARRQSKPCDDITEAIDPVFNRIMTLPATTIDGLAVKAGIVRHYYEKDSMIRSALTRGGMMGPCALVEAVSDNRGPIV
jgi:hypothetical protein